MLLLVHQHKFLKMLFISRKNYDLFYSSSFKTGAKEHSNNFGLSTILLIDEFIENNDERIDIKKYLENIKTPNVNKKIRFLTLL